MRRVRDSAAAPFACLVLLFIFLVVFHVNVSFKWTLYSPTYSMITTGKNRDVKVMQRQPAAELINCDRSHREYDICTINATTLLDPTTTTFFLVEPTTQAVLEKVRPYPRKWETSVMARIKEVSLSSGSAPPPNPECQVHHSSPALVFSAGGYTGNVFHDFNDGFIPLFITVKTIFPDSNFVLVVQNCRSWWQRKYADLIRTLTNHPVVNLDDKANFTHCFPYAHVGLISHGFMTINPALMPRGSMNLTYFHDFLSTAYAQKYPSSPSSSSIGRPRLVLMTRSPGVGRHVLNHDDLFNAAREVGFDVTIFHPTATTSMREAYTLINSSHAMIGVHGAALTHSLFLRRGSVFMQVVPLGLAWVAELCFGKSARELGLEYMEYKIGEEESSLREKYGKGHAVVKDPVGVQGRGWPTKIMEVYLKEQNVKLNMVRFRRHLEEAYQKANTLLQREGQ